MTVEVQNNTNIMLRNDTILGVCEAIGEETGINPNWLLGAAGVLGLLGLV